MGKAEEVISTRFNATRWNMTPDQVRDVYSTLKQECEATLVWLEANEWPDEISRHPGFIELPSPASGLQESRAMWLLTKTKDEFYLDSLGNIWISKENAWGKEILDLSVTTLPYLRKLTEAVKDVRSDS